MRRICLPNHGDRFDPISVPTLSRARYLPLMTKHRLDRLGSKIWYQAVELGLGLDSPYAVELFLEGDRVKCDADGIKRPRKWRQYCEGKRTPEDIPGKLNVFDIAEREASGTARWFRSTLWKALKGEVSCSDDLWGRPGERATVEGVVFSTGESIEYDLPEENGYPAMSGSAPVRRFEIHRIQDCVILEGLDLLEAVVLLLEYGNLLKQPAITTRSLDLYRSVSPKISKIPQLRSTFDQFFDAVEDRYANLIGSPIDEIFPPWHVRMPHLTEIIYDMEEMKAEAVAWDGVVKRKRAKAAK